MARFGLVLSCSFACTLCNLDCIILSCLRITAAVPYMCNLDCIILFVNNNSCILMESWPLSMDAVVLAIYIVMYLWCLFTVECLHMPVHLDASSLSLDLLIFHCARIIQLDYRAGGMVLSILRLVTIQKQGNKWQKIQLQCRKRGAWPAEEVGPGKEWQRSKNSGSGANPSHERESGVWASSEHELNRFFLSLLGSAHFLCYSCSSRLTQYNKCLHFSILPCNMWIQFDGDHMTPIWWRSDSNLMEIILPVCN